MSISEVLSSEVLTPEALVEQLRAMRRHIPEYVQLTAEERKAIRRLAKYDPEFVQATINSTGASVRVGAALGRTSPEMRQMTEEAARWTAYEDELRAHLQGVAATNLVRRYRIGLAAEQAYNICRQLVREKDQATDLVPHVEGMKRIRIRRRGRANASPTAPPAPAATPDAEAAAATKKAS